MKNIHLQLRNLIGQIESAMIQTCIIPFSMHLLPPISKISFESSRLYQSPPHYTGASNCTQSCFGKTLNHSGVTLYGCTGSEGGLINCNNKTNDECGQDAGIVCGKFMDALTPPPIKLHYYLPQPIRISP